MAKKRVLVIVPLALDEAGIAKRRAQTQSVDLGPDISFDYRGVRAGPVLYDSYHDFAMADIAAFDAGLSAEADGYDAVCIDTMSDSGMNALRTMLDIPVIGPGLASYHMALILGSRFGVLAQWGPWEIIYKKTLQEYGLADKCVGIRSPNIEPDPANLLGGKEDEIFPKLLTWDEFFYLTVAQWWAQKATSGPIGQKARANLKRIGTVLAHIAGAPELPPEKRLQSKRAARSRSSRRATTRT